MILEKVYDELMAQIEDLKKAVAAMGGGSSSVDYETQVTNLPKVNNITLKGNKKSSDLKIAYSMTEAEYAAASKNAESIYCLQENATTFEEEDELSSASIEWSAGDPSGYVATLEYAPSNQNFTGCTAVECDDAAITVETFTVVEGNVQVFLSCEDTTQIGETVTFTYTLTQPAGATRIVKNGVAFASAFSEVLDIPRGDGTNSRHFSFATTPKKITMFWDEGGTASSWCSYYSFIWGDRRAYGFNGNADSSTSGQTVKVASISYDIDNKGFTITAPNAGSAVNSSGTDDYGLMYIEY